MKSLIVDKNNEIVKCSDLFCIVKLTIIRGRQFNVLGNTLLYGKNYNNLIILNILNSSDKLD